MNTLALPCVLASTLIASSLSAQTCTTTILNPVADTSIGDATQLDGPGLANGSGLTIGAGWRQIVNVCIEERALVRFGVGTSQQIPAGATVATAELVLSVLCPGTTPQFAVHRLLESWGESTSAAVCSLTTPAPGDATWYERYSGVSPSLVWPPGGRYDPTPSAVASVAGSELRFSSPQLAIDVQDWLSSPETNHGWIIVATDFPCSSGTVNPLPTYFVSRENQAASLRPRLEVCATTATTGVRPVTSWFGPPTGIDPTFCPPALFAVTQPRIASTFTLRGEWPGMTMMGIILFLGDAAAMLPSPVPFAIPPQYSDPVAINAVPSIYGGPVAGSTATTSGCGVVGTVVQLPLWIPNDFAMIGLVLNWQMIGVASSPAPRLVGTNGLFTRLGA